MQRALLCLFAVLFIFSGCTDEENPLGVDLVYYTLTVTGLPENLTGVEGTEYQLPFSVIVLQLDGSAAAGVEVNLSIEVGEATLSPAHATTDADGNAEVVCTLQMPAEDSMLQIMAKAGASTQLIIINLHYLDCPAVIQLSAETTTLRILPGQSAELELTVLVTDLNGVGIPGILPDFILLSSAPEAEIFGSLSRPSITDDNGRSVSIFCNNNSFGQVIVRCSVGGETEEGEPLISDLLLTVERLLPEDAGGFSLNATPSYFRIHPDSIAVAEINARVVDADNNGIAGVQVSMSSDIGSLSRPTLTDDNGLAIATFTNNYEFGTATINAWIEGSELLVTATILIESKFGDNLELTLMSDVSSIYADNGYTTAELTALLKDENGSVIPDAEITFGSTFGAAAPATVITDTLGVARAVFTDIGLPSVDQDGNPIPAVITAVHQYSGSEASVEVTIWESPDLERIELQANRREMVTDSHDSCLVKAICYKSESDRAPAGALVTFETNNGRLSDESVYTNEFGEAVINYYPGYRPGIALIIARHENVDSTISSNAVEVNIRPGSPVSMRLRTDCDELTTNEPSMYATITATVVDTGGNAVGGVPVSFEATYGSLNRSSMTTGDDGTASVRLHPGVITGSAVITAAFSTPEREITRQITINITSSGPSTIQLTVDPTTIQARAGTSTIAALLFDANGNPVSAPYWISFQLINEPSEDEGGSSINMHGCLDSATTSAGVARVTLNAGALPHTVLIRAYTWRDTEGSRLDTVSSIISRVQIIGGPPDQINIDISSEGVDIGGGSWQIEVAARVWNEYMTPVEDGIPVQFSVDSSAVIEWGETGNQNMDGESHPGIAFTTLTYNSTNTFDSLTVVAEVRTQERIISAERFFQLPLQRGSIVLDISPENWMIDRDDYANIRCWATVRDGHNVLINNAPVVFTANRGLFYWFNHVRNRYELYDYLDDPPVPALKYTGWHINNGHSTDREDRGEATVYLQGEEPDFFLDPVTPEVAVIINARIEGYDDVIAEPRVATIIRHP
ncbi:MAG: Ig-like domain-containing protein [Candidatus Hatepunaea meridiana]|nr:Ig-like domain-containing protein [Candidatus Hatepunaea meridiana]